MDYLVRHRTTYRYLHEVSFSQHMVHLEPRTTPFQQVEAVVVAVTPAPATRTRRLDAFGNATEWLMLDEPHETFEIVAESQVKVAAPPKRDPAKAQSWEAVRQRLAAASLPGAKDAEALEATGYLFDTAYTGFTVDLASYASPCFPTGRLVPGRCDGPDAPHPSRLPLRHHGHRRLHAGRPRASRSAPASARTSRTWRSPACIRWGCRRATSAATC